MAKGKHPNSLAALKKHQVKKGQILNPAGVNRKRPWSEELLLESDTLLSESEDGEKIRLLLKLPADATWKQAGARVMVRSGVGRRDLAMLRECMDRIEGTPARKMEISTPGNKVLRIKVVYDRVVPRGPISEDE